MVLVCFTFSESPEVPLNEVFGSFTDANAALAPVSVPTDGTYHKTDFWIMHDGETYKGRIDLAPGEKDVKAHAIEWCRDFVKPGHLTRKLLEEIYKTQEERDAHVALCAKWLTIFETAY